MSKGLIQVATAGEGLCNLEPMLRTVLSGLISPAIIADLWFSRLNQRR